MEKVIASFLTGKLKGEGPKVKFIHKREIFTRAEEKTREGEYAQGKAVQGRKGDSILSTNATALCYASISSA